MHLCQIHLAKHLQKQLFKKRFQMKPQRAKVNLSNINFLLFFLLLFFNNFFVNWITATRRTAMKPKTFICPHCDRGFTTSSALNVHKNQNCKKRPSLKEKLFKCKICHTGFDVFDGLRTHINYVKKQLVANKELPGLPEHNKPESGIAYLEAYKKDSKNFVVEDVEGDTS